MPKILKRFYKFIRYAIMDIGAELDLIEAQTRQGRLGSARMLIRKISLKGIKRTHRLRLAQLARRVGLSLAAVRILNPIVRPKKILLDPASHSEKAEYAAALIDAGAVNEGNDLLVDLDYRREPRILLFRSFGLFTHWDYAAAVPLLETYIKTCRDDYQKLVGQVNLAAALVTLNKSEQAEPVLKSLVELTQKQGHLRLHANCLELLAQLHFTRDQFAKAEKCLEEASEVLKSTGSLDEFFVKKWSLFLEMSKRPVTESDRKRLDLVKATALRKNHWEGARDCDYFLAKRLNDVSLLTHLYFSTPHQGFRDRVKNVLKGEPAEYIWNLKSDHKRPHTYFDLASGRDSRSDISLKVDQLPYRMLVILSADFYKKSRVPALFANLYPGEYYDPETSHFRVHQVLERLKKWFTVNELPLAISEDHGFYSLDANGTYGIRKTLHDQKKTPLEKKIWELTHSVRGSEFSTVALAQSSGRPLRSVQRLIEAGVKTGILEQTGETWNRSYKFKKSV
jgi:tetratricopeptide (TPR) repeat protein